MKRRILVTLMGALALTLLLSGVGQAFVLDGNILTVGVGPSGGLVDLAATPAFPGDNGQGITFKPVLPGIPNDFSAPGTPWEFYSIGVGGTIGVRDATKFVTGGVANLPGGIVKENPSGLPLTTANNSGGTTLQATTSGPAFNVDGGSIIYTQQVTFDTTFNHIHVSADILNNSLVDLHNVVYARGIDPDQDVAIGGGFATINTINPDGSVTAFGTKSGLSITLRDLTFPALGIHGVASISDSSPAFPWETDPYILVQGGFVDGASFTTSPRDWSINMAWLIGDLPHGTSVELDFEYEFSFVPVPPAVWLFGSGLLGLGVLRWRRS